MQTAISIALSIIATLGLYPKTLVVQSVKPESENYIVEFVDAQDRIWIWEDENGDMDRGDVYSAIMYDCGTQNVRDDAIVTIRYSGFQN